MHQQLQAAYVLHRRPFRDNSVLVEAFSAEHGRLSLLARGLGRRRHGGALGALLQPFRPLLLSFRGKGELLTLTGAELGGELAQLQGDAALSGLYLNELLLRLLHRFVAHPTLFGAYATALADLAASRRIEPVLRRFEFALLDELGYGVDLCRDADSGESLRADRDYMLIAERGFCAVGDSPSGHSAAVFPGGDLLAMATGSFESADARNSKRLVRLLLRPHLGERPLRSRALFAAAATQRADAPHEPGPESE